MTQIKQINTDKKISTPVTGVFFPLSLFSFLSLYLFSSCATDYPVIQRVVAVPLPVLSDSVNVVYKTDTLILGTHAHMNDTVVRIEYLPGKDKFFYRIKQDTLFIPVSDTVYLTKFLKPDNTTFYFIIGGVLIFLIFLWLLYPK